MDNKEILARSRDAIRALEAGVELSVEERWACYEALQFYLDWNKEDDDELWAGPDVKYRAVGGDRLTLTTHAYRPGSSAEFLVGAEPWDRILLENPTQGQVRRLVKALGAVEDKP